MHITSLICVHAPTHFFYTMFTNKQIHHTVCVIREYLLQISFYSGFTNAQISLSIPVNT